MKRLLLMRHAKATPYEPGADRERPLVERGHRDAKAMGEYIRDAGLAPGLVLCSSATRARETLEGVLPALGADAEARIEPRIYGASADELLRIVHELDESVQTAILIGHNPGTHQLAASLAGTGDGFDQMLAKFPTAAVAELRFDGLWALLAPGDAELASFVAPKDRR